jgi:hypothetical protein
LGEDKGRAGLLDVATLLEGTSGAGLLGTDGAEEMSSLTVQVVASNTGLLINGRAVAEGSFAGRKAGAIDVAVILADEIADDTVVLLSPVLTAELFVRGGKFEVLEDVT